VSIFEKVHFIVLWGWERNEKYDLFSIELHCEYTSEEREKNRTCKT